MNLHLQFVRVLRCHSHEYRYRRFLLFSCHACTYQNNIARHLTITADLYQTLEAHTSQPTPPYLVANMEHDQRRSHKHICVDDLLQHLYHGCTAVYPLTFTPTILICLKYTYNPCAFMCRSGDRVTVFKLERNGSTISHAA